jgi:hypothetical protein
VARRCIQSTAFGRGPRPLLGEAPGYVQLVRDTGATARSPGEPVELPVSGRVRAVAVGDADGFLADALDGIGEAEQAQVRDVLARVRANVAPGAATGKRRAS